jgi:hypothetical protein
MPDTQIPVSHLFTLTLEGLAQDRHDFMGPFGRRIFEKSNGGAAAGAKIRGKVLPLLATDYGNAGSDGKIRHFDSSVTLQAEDGTILLMQYRGRASPAYGPGQSRIQAMFTTGAGTHDWLNGIQAIGFGTEGGGHTRFEVYVLTGAPEAEGAASDVPHGPDRTSVPAQFLFRRKSEHIPGAERHTIRGPLGSRYLTLAEGGGAFAGPAISGEFLAGYSWSPHRIGQQDGQPLLQYDVRTLLRTNEGVPVLMSYTGAYSKSYPAMSWMTGVLFEVPEGPAAWLNEIQGVGVGRWAGDGAEYIVYALR